MTLVAQFRTLAILATVVAPVVGLHPGMAAEAGKPGSPIGYWLTESGDGVIEVAPCGNALCGRIVGIGRKPDEPIPRDVHGRSQCGLTIIEKEVPTSPGTWDGTVTDPRDGRTYGARLWVDKDDRLHVRGYLGIPLLGDTQTWTRYKGHLSEGCRLG
ncbi:MAG: hypothetical protein QOK29_558 [Rhodospirillaceae bacterium]|jgi:uncharacterized protein (DUF2147 family)|nr:hypothetical protein [Rhodospirillaceae bacterium]